MAGKESTSVVLPKTESGTQRTAFVTVSGPGVVSVSASSVLESKAGKRQIAALHRFTSKRSDSKAER